MSGALAGSAMRRGAAGRPRVQRSRGAGGRSHAQRSRRAGFTLIELVVSLLIIAVMAAVAAPAFLSERAPPAMDDAQGRIEALFRLARDSAVRSATPVSVVVDSASSLVWLDMHSRLTTDLPADPQAVDAGLGGGFGGSDAVLPDGSIRLRTDGGFGGSSSLGMGLGNPGGAFRTPENGESLDLPPGIELELFQARSRFTFQPNGSVMGDSLLLRAVGGEVRMITLDPWSGRARVR